MFGFTRTPIWRGLFCLLALLLASVASAEGQSTEDAIAAYRASLQDGNPADLNSARGELLWKQTRGPNKQSLQSCDLGLGPGKVAGAVAHLPRYFADTGKVMDLESRLVYCMVRIQGFKPEEFTTATAFSREGADSTVIEDLVAYIYDASRGQTIAVPQDTPQEREAYARGKEIFFYKGGTHDFSCASCHGQDGRRIRLQDLPNLTKTAPAREAFSQWPAYRLSQGALRTMQWRLYDCFRQQRFPELKYLSPASVDLITFLGVNANGGTMNAPGIKR